MAEVTIDIDALLEAISNQMARCELGEDQGYGICDRCLAAALAPFLEMEAREIERWL